MDLVEATADGEAAVSSRREYGTCWVQPKADEGPPRRGFVSRAVCRHVVSWSRADSTLSECKELSPGDRMATTDYDAPRRRAAEDDEVTSLEALAGARAEKQSPLADVDEGDTDDAVDLPGAD